jgi:hypothetical protein
MSRDKAACLDVLSVKAGLTHNMRCIMSQADSINTTSRRGFLARGAATVAGGAMVLATLARHLLP